MSASFNIAHRMTHWQEWWARMHSWIWSSPRNIEAPDGNISCQSRNLRRGRSYSRWDSHKGDQLIPALASGADRVSFLWWVQLSKSIAVPRLSVRVSRCRRDSYLERSATSNNVQQSNSPCRGRSGPRTCISNRITRILSIAGRRNPAWLTYEHDCKQSNLRRIHVNIQLCLY